MADTPATQAPQSTGNSTMASAGIGGSVAIVLLSIGLHLNIHLSEEEAVAWTAILTAGFGWVTHFVERRWPATAPVITNAEGEVAVLAPAVATVVKDELPVSRPAAPPVPAVPPVAETKF